MSSNKRALAAYRHGLRATRVAFDGDLPVLLAARAKMRQGMVHPPNPDLPVDKQISHLEEVAKFLRKNLVQGKKSETEEKYHLNIHKDTELGDNESIQKTKQTLAAQGGGCCGGGKDLYK